MLVTTQTQVGFQLGSNPNSDVAPASPLPAHADPLGQVIVVDAPGEHQQPTGNAPGAFGADIVAALGGLAEMIDYRLQVGARLVNGQPSFTEAIDNVAGILTGAGWSIVEVKQSAVIGIDQAAVAAAFQLIVVARKQAG